MRAPSPCPNYNTYHTDCQCISINILKKTLRKPQKEGFTMTFETRNALTVPYVIKQTPAGERSYDIFSRLLEDRIILLNGEVDDVTSALVCSQLLYLTSCDSTRDISLYINSPGGSVSAGLAIYDTMNFIKPDVATICMGVAASMGALLLSSGAKGKRFCLPNAEVMIHQPLGGAKGQATDIMIAANHIVRTKKRLTTIIADNTGRTYDEVETACDRDNWFDAQEAKDFGIVDDIITKMP